MAKKQSKRQTVSGELRRAIRDCGLSQYEVAKRSGVDAGALSRFLSGQRTLTLPAVDKLANLLGMVLAPQQHERDKKAR